MQVVFSIKKDVYVISRRVYKFKYYFDGIDHTWNGYTNKILIPCDWKSYEQALSAAKGFALDCALLIEIRKNYKHVKQKLQICKKTEVV